METRPAVVLSLLIVVWVLMRARKPINPRVALLNPTTTWPIATVIAAVVAGVVVFIMAATLAENPLVAVAMGGVVGYLILLAGRVKAGTRVVYDRGGSFVPPGAVVAGGALFVVLFLPSPAETRPTAASEPA